MDEPVKPIPNLVEMNHRAMDDALWGWKAEQQRTWEAMHPTMDYLEQRDAERERAE